MKNRFLQFTIGISLVICSVAFLLRSIQPAHAEPTPQEFIDEGSNSIGKYQITFQVANDPETVYFYAIVYNTQTGASTIYGRNTNTGGPWEAWTNQLPAPTK